jgi:hypothetical protein
VEGVSKMLVSYEINENNMPITLLGDKFRFNYLVRKLVNNSSERCSISLVSRINLKFYFSNANNLIDDEIRSEDLQDGEQDEPIQCYLVCEVADGGKTLTK